MVMMRAIHEAVRDRTDRTKEENRFRVVQGAQGSDTGDYDVIDTHGDSAEDRIVDHFGTEEEAQELVAKLNIADDNTIASYL